MGEKSLVKPNNVKVYKPEAISLSVRVGPEDLNPDLLVYVT